MVAKKHEAKTAPKKTSPAHHAQPVAVASTPPRSADSSPVSSAPIPSSPRATPPAFSSTPLSKPSPPTIPPSRTGLSLQQKVALIGGALLLVLILGSALWPSLAIGNANDNYLQFKTAIEDNNQSGILMDLRGAPAGARQKILQCGVDLISSGFFTAAQKDLLVYSCDDSGCLSSHFIANKSETVNTSIPFSDALYGLRGRPYFHLLYSSDPKAPLFTPVYSEVYLTADSNETCGINITG